MLDTAGLSSDPGDISLQMLIFLRDELRRRGYQQDTPEHIRACVTTLGYLAARLAGVSTDPKAVILSTIDTILAPATLKLAKAINAALEDMAAAQLASTKPEPKNVVPLKRP